ncbi:hypothetical protein [Streptomyces sp. NPDC058240]|uniref:hypothetical protein n=1 Tax=Streptomyces sp. NPDC058240 TaxID=3346396 RepID=UPI0036E05DEC
MNDTEQLLAAAEKTARTASRREKHLLLPGADAPGHAWYADQPDLAQRLGSWLDGTAWYSEESEDETADPAPWPEFSART